MSTNALSIDLEDYFHVSNFQKLLDRDSWDSLPSRVEASTHRLLDAFDETRSRATFFVLGWVADRHPALISEIAKRGHEIACHGYYHELVYEIGPKRFRDDLRRSCDVIEKVSGRVPRGYRAPSYSVTEKSLWALDILAEEGFTYDSSIFPIHHHRYGIPSFERRPVRLSLPGGACLDEFPMTTLQMGRMRIPMAGGAYLRFIPESLFRWGFERLVNSGQPTVLYLHPWEIDPDQPRQDASLKLRINHYYNLHRTEARLRRLLEAFEFAPLADVLARLKLNGQLPQRPLFSKVAPLPRRELRAA